jgi:hypothetical protein
MSEPRQGLLPETILRATHRKPPDQKHPLVVDNLNIISIGSGGEACFISRHGLFQLFASLYIAFLAGLKSSAKHPLIKGPQSSA